MMVQAIIKAMGFGHNEHNVQGVKLFIRICENVDTYA